LAVALPDFLTRYPRITFDFVVTNREVNLVDDSIDVALQVGSLGKPSSVARRITALTQIVCASPAYLARHGRPASPADLAHHACLTLSHITGSKTWRFKTGNQAIEVEVNGPVVADSAHMLLKLAIEGAGIIRFGDIIVAHAVRDGMLLPVLEDWQELDNFPLWATYRSGRDRVPRIKAFLEFLMERFGSAPWRSRPRT
jgi:DNA-binding transcriptional LysR family regulator